MAYKKVTVKIPNVTGNIVVNVTTQGSIHNLFDVNNSILNARIGAAGDLKAAGSANGVIVSNEIDISAIDDITISGISAVVATSYNYSLRYYYYDETHRPVIAADNYAQPFTTFHIHASSVKASHPNIKYIRISICVKDAVAISAADVNGLMILDGYL